MFFSEIKDFTIVDNIVYGLKSDNKYSVIKATTRITELYLPSEVDGKEVTSIAGSAFKDDFNLGQVDLGKNIQSIGSYAFSGCINAIITLPETIENINAYAFQNAKTVFFDSDANIDIELIDKYAFSGCDSISFPGGKIKTINSNAFDSCRLAYFDCSITTIGTYAFQNTECVKMYNNIGTIDKYAFNSCEYIYFDDLVSISIINSYAFQNAKIYNLVILSSISYIGSYAFNGSSLTYLEFDGTLEEFNSVSKEWFIATWNSGSNICYVECSDSLLYL